MVTGVYVLFFIIGAVFAEDDQKPKIRFYHDSFENYTEFPFDAVTNIFSTSWYDSNKTTVIFCHGFTGYPKGPAVTAIITAYLEQGHSNVALLNWQYLASAIYNSIPASYLNWAVPNAMKVGADFGDTLLSLSEAGLDLNKTRLIGHSLGAQVMGMAGNRMIMNNVVLPWITGLDPAGIAFDGRLPRDRLNPNSALFVDVIHSDPNRYGSRRSLGTVDFWPNYRNGQFKQPGCENPSSNAGYILPDLCNHNKCWEYLLDTMKYPGTIMGSYAKNYRTWLRYTKEQRTEIVLELGKFAPNAYPGDYYLTTTGASPFGLGEDGL